jgi:hypothetical protein
MWVVNLVCHLKQSELGIVGLCSSLSMVQWLPNKLWTPRRYRSPGFRGTLRLRFEQSSTHKFQPVWFMIPEVQSRIVSFSAALNANCNMKQACLHYDSWGTKKNRSSACKHILLLRDVTILSPKDVPSADAIIVWCDSELHISHIVSHVSIQ